MRIKTPFNKDRIFFLSDPHFHHANILDYSRRYFSYKDLGSKKPKHLTTEDMNSLIIRCWNDAVSDGDAVFMLGDFIWSDSPYRYQQIIDQLNGQIYHVRGNHDKCFIKNNTAKASPLETCDILEIKVYDEDAKGAEQDIVMCHFPMASWAGKERGSFHLYGHCHNSYKHPSWNAIDVGVDTRTKDGFFNPTPYSYEEIKIVITQKFLEP